MGLHCQAALMTLAAKDFFGLVGFYCELFEQEPVATIAQVYAEFQLPGLRLGIFKPTQSNEGAWTDASEFVFGGGEFGSGDRASDPSRLCTTRRNYDCFSRKRNLCRRSRRQSFNSAQQQQPCLNLRSLCKLDVVWIDPIQNPKSGEWGVGSQNPKSKIVRLSAHDEAQNPKFP
jgi:hypothetical protein